MDETNRRDARIDGTFRFEGEGVRMAVTLTLRLEPKGERRTIDLEPAPERPLEATFTAVAYENRRGRWVEVAAGQCVALLDEWFPNDIEARRISALWRRWHLNCLQAGCREQRDFLAAKYPDGVDYKQALRALDWAGAWEAPSLIDVRGYGYGTAWLVELLPADVEAELREAIALASA
ncbi:MAG: hypothetical protein FJ298_16070 [Planctomycetes bacterium]|nr:hypothetical protein [Planctomycetota bacterium]